MSDDSKKIEELVKEEFPEAQISKKLAVIEGEYKDIQPFDTEAIGKMYKAMKAFVSSEMHEDLDFGTIPGTGKRSLYKPGAEKLHTFFGFSVEIKDANIIEKWEDPITEDKFPLFHYRYTTKVWNHSGTKLIATCDGEANSYEIKYRWRWVQEHEVPKKYDKEKLDKKERSESEFKFAVDAAKTTGEYAKPQSYWDSWKVDIDSGVAKSIKRKARSGAEFDAWERGGVFYRIPNEDIYTQVNTLIKMAIKRSYVGAIIIAANASDYFTQDIEDFAENVQSEPVSIKMFVPDRKAASLAIMEYAESLGVKDGGQFVKDLLETNNLDFSLDKWLDIVELVDEHATL